ncbi:hypothetical protein WK18_28870 [Burkholderia ubonensis]|nr:hypothetical protein WK18_28870 [Burkholderia ubonensis]KWB81407.1 hypothetical protein WL41_03865 [Burkholderia ubonensis]
MIDDSKTGESEIDMTSHTKASWNVERLFSDTVTGPQASVNLYSLVETCKANGIEAYRYLAWLFAKLPLAAAADDYAALMPWKMPAELR